MNRIIFLLSFALVASLARAYDFSAEIGGQECYFNVIDRGVCEITYADSVRIDGVDYFNTERKYAGELAVPYSVEHEGVEFYIARIGDHAFQNCAELTKIDIRYICEEIGRDAFEGCVNLREIITGDATDAQIEPSGAIQNCAELTKIDIRYICEEIGRDAFEGCVNLREIITGDATDAQIEPSGAIPTLYIDTEGQKPVTSKTVYLNATYTIENAGEYNVQQQPLQIRGRGNSSWKGEKKPYKLKLGEKTKLLGMKSDRHWALINGTQWVRQMAGFELGNRLGMAWNPSSRPVEVVLNGEYIGLYLLMETVRTDKNRVAIDEQPDLCNNPDSLAGGWLVEVDNYYDERQMIVPECPQWQMRVTWHTPEELSPMQRDWLRNEFTQMNADIYSSAKDEALLESHLDLNAMARFFIAQEVMDNPDGFHGSFFLHRPYGGVWTAGPLWDVTCMEREKTDYTFRMKVSYGFTPHLIGELLKYGTFRDAVNRQWQAFFPAADSWTQYISDLYSEALATADRTNNARWPSASYKGLQAKISNTRYWYEKNLEWFSGHLPEPTSEAAEVNTVKTIPPPSAIYNLQGQRLSVEAGKGLYIIKGKKIIKK